MKRFLTILLCASCLFTSPVHAEEIVEPTNLYAQAAVLMDADSGRILFSKNDDEVLAMASTTKIMTCILALELGNMDDIVTTSEHAVEQPKVHLDMKEGEQFYLKDLLYSLMLESHNDSAVAIAEHIGGSVEKFATYMNQKAAELKCEDTYFITPNGLDATDENGSHSTTAADLATIMSYCITKSTKREEFLKITSTVEYSFSDVTGSRSFSCNNHNSFLTMMDGAISGKTGFTGKAGYCYVGALKEDDRTFVVALLACGWPNHKNYKWEDTLKLMKYGVENYTYQDVYEQIELPEIVVEDAIPENGNLYTQGYVQLKVDAKEDETLNVLLRKDEEVEILTDYISDLEAPLKQGEQVGTVIYQLNGENIKEYSIVVEESVAKKDLSWYFTKILKEYMF